MLVEVDSFWPASAVHGRRAIGQKSDERVLRRWLWPTPLRFRTSSADAPPPGVGLLVWRGGLCREQAAAIVLQCLRLVKLLLLTLLLLLIALIMLWTGRRRLRILSLNFFVLLLLLW